MPIKRILTLCSEDIVSGQVEQQSQYSGYSEVPSQALQQIFNDISRFLATLQEAIAKGLTTSGSKKPDMTPEEQVNYALDILNKFSKNKVAAEKQISPES